MSTHEAILLRSVVSQKKANGFGHYADSTYFELFVAEQVLKDFELSDAELQAGHVGQGDDGGIDGFYTLIDGSLLMEDSEIAAGMQSPSVVLWAIQAKTDESYQETAIDRINTSLTQLLNLSSEESGFSTIYNARLVSNAMLFRSAYKSLAARFPSLSIVVCYASYGTTSEVHPKVTAKCDQLQKAINSLWPHADVSIQLWGAAELLKAARRTKTTTLKLNFLEHYISTAQDNYIVLVSLKEYFEFVTDESGNLSRHIFDSNVRDFQGYGEVNKDIRASLTEGNDVDFWWLNNGITVLASAAQIAGKSIVLEDVQIVNGLQTTRSIYDYMIAMKPETDPRAVLMRIIIAKDPRTRDRVIKATNFQTSIQPASLRALDDIQRNIEHHFFMSGWFYDRRKNFYKNQGQRSDRIISIPFLAQAVMALVLQEPDNSRARPSSLIKKENDYRRVFDPNLPLDLYLFCASTMAAVERFAYTKGTILSPGDTVSTTVPWQHAGNFRFHLGMQYLIDRLNSAKYRPKDIATLSGAEPTDHQLSVSLGKVKTAVEQIMAPGSIGHDWPMDRIAKSREFVTELLRAADRGSSTGTAPTT